MTATDLMDPATDAPLETPCRLNPDAWFPEGDGGRRYVTARKWCQRCPATDRCLQVALNLEAGLGRKERHGMWGAATPLERAQMGGVEG